MDPYFSFLPQSSILQPSSRLLLGNKENEVLLFVRRWAPLSNKIGNGSPLALACQLYPHELISYLNICQLNDQSLTSEHYVG